MDAFFSSFDKHLIVETNIDGLTSSSSASMLSNFPIFYANPRAKVLSKRMSEFLNFSVCFSIMIFNAD